MYITAIFAEDDVRRRQPAVTFISLKTRVLELLLRALTVETDSTNTQMLLGECLVFDTCVT